MTRATLKIVTQPWGKLERLIHLVLREIFGVSADYHQSIFDFWQTHGIYHYRPLYSGHTATIALFPYRLPIIHRAIYQMKFRNKRSYIPLFGSLIADVLIDTLAELADTHDFNEPLLVVVPSLHKHIRKRGAHITHELARAACANGLDAWADFQPKLLTQIRNKAKQSRLKNRKQRLNNPRGAYAITKPIWIRGRNIILLDDVYTTGATLDEITRVLYHSGARRVIRITVAH